MKIPPLKKTYGGRTVLNTPELELEHGKIYAVVGANGSGKSTMAKLLAGVEKSDSGAVSLSGSVGYMPQKSYAFRMSMRKNILLGGSSAEKCNSLMQSLRIGHLADKAAYKLSGGETARMALARLMMKDYALVILDEPTAAMDMESTLFSEKMLADYCRESGCAMLLVTHSLQQAKRIADSVIFMDKGEIVETGLKDDVLLYPKDERTRRFLDFYGV